MQMFVILPHVRPQTTCHCFIGVVVTVMLLSDPFHCRCAQTPAATNVLVLVTNGSQLSRSMQHCPGLSERYSTGGDSHRSVHSQRLTGKYAYLGWESTVSPLASRWHQCHWFDSFNPFSRASLGIWLRWDSNPNHHPALFFSLLCLASLPACLRANNLINDIYHNTYFRFCFGQPLLGGYDV